MWQRNETAEAQIEIDQLRAKLRSGSVPPTDQIIETIYQKIAYNLDTKGAIESIISWSESAGTGGDAEDLERVLDSLLGITLAL